MTHTILGAGGAIGVELAKSLAAYSNPIRLVGRNPKKVNASDELFKADLLSASATADAVKGSSVAYLTVGLPYRIDVWQRDWPIVMKNAIDACKRHHVKLVFFDNVYMYGLVKGKMTEDTPFNPNSKKGEVRAKIAEMLLREIKQGNLTALIARAPDFYGINVQTSILDATVIQNLRNGKSAQWLCNADTLHNFIFTPDAGKATALLGNTEHAFNQTWHLPTAEAITGRVLIALFAKAFNTSPKTSVLSPLMITLLGLFIPVLKEFKEMLYQYEFDYQFDSSKFQNAFGMSPTRYEDGVKMIAASCLSQSRTTHPL
ncbi:MAG: NAD-dependent epimerase/dehydratase family protein [Chloroherpetonaceae bacterium]